MTSATRPLLRQIENLQASLGSQTASWEKLEKSFSDRLGETLDTLYISMTITCSQNLNISFALFLISGSPGTAGCSCGERAIGNRRTVIHEVSAGLSGIPDFFAPSGKGPNSDTAGG